MATTIARYRESQIENVHALAKIYDEEPTEWVVSFRVNRSTVRLEYVTAETYDAAVAAALARTPGR